MWLTSCSVYSSKTPFRPIRLRRIGSWRLTWRSFSPEKADRGFGGLGTALGFGEGVCHKEISISFYRLHMIIADYSTVHSTMCGRYFPHVAREYSVQGATCALGYQQFLGDPSEEDPLGPIPNTAGNLLSPDGTARASVWESRTSSGLNQRISLRQRPFVIRRFALSPVCPVTFSTASSRQP